MTTDYKTFGDDRPSSRQSRHLQTPVEALQNSEDFEHKGLNTFTETGHNNENSIRNDIHHDDSETVKEKNTEDEKKEKSEKSKKLTSRQKWTIASMAFANFSLSACFGILAPFFPQEASKKGASKTVIGLIFGGFELVVFLTSPIFGQILTKLGAKFTFVSGIFLGGGCMILFGFLDLMPDGTVFIVFCFACRSIEAIGCAMFITASFAIIALEFPGQVATYIGLLETFSGIGMMTGPPLGGVLYEAGGYKLPFIVMGGTMLLCSLTTYFILPQHNQERKAFSGSVLSLAKLPSVLVLCFVIVASSSCLGFLDPTLANHLDDVANTTLNTAVKGVIFLVAPGLYGLSAPLLGAFNDRFGFTRTMMIGGCFVSMVSYFLMGPSPLSGLPKKLWIVIVSLVPMGLGVSAALLPIFQEVIHRAQINGFPEDLDTYGMVSGLFNSCFSLGAFTGPTLGGYLNDELGFAWASTIFCFIVGGVGVLICIFYAVFHKLNKDIYLVEKYKTTSTSEERQSILKAENSNYSAVDGRTDLTDTRLQNEDRV